MEKTSRVIAKRSHLLRLKSKGQRSADLFGLLQLGRSLRGSGKKNTYNLLRWAPMAVADLVSEFFENDLLRATLLRAEFSERFSGLVCRNGLVLLLRAAADPKPAGSNFFAAAEWAPSRKRWQGRPASRSRDSHRR